MTLIRSNNLIYLGNEFQTKLADLGNTNLNKTANRWWIGTGPDVFGAHYTAKSPLLAHNPRWYNRWWGLLRMQTMMSALVRLRRKNRNCSWWLKSLWLHRRLQHFGGFAQWKLKGGSELGLQQKTSLSLDPIFIIPSGPGQIGPPLFFLPSPSPHFLWPSRGGLTGDRKSRV